MYASYVTHRFRLPCIEERRENAKGPLERKGEETKREKINKKKKERNSAHSILTE